MRENAAWPWRVCRATVSARLAFGREKKSETGPRHYRRLSSSPPPPQRGIEVRRYFYFFALFLPDSQPYAMGKKNNKITSVRGHAITPRLPSTGGNRLHGTRGRRSGNNNQLACGTIKVRGPRARGRRRPRWPRPPPFPTRRLFPARRDVIRPRGFFLFFWPEKNLTYATAQCLVGFSNALYTRV